ncbi:CLUMA_CG003183, isoform A [Clunio marinus]|uniref:CLUMA_CG003183, isoform A n=1 Tax=Clunio marinus TaxID=568069 RepID=A0A1J1HN07_9DIPT|nr:CLUMA_CG003183, isoform A [Clunio marinus]
MDFGKASKTKRRSEIWNLNENILSPFFLLQKQQQQKKTKIENKIREREEIFTPFIRNHSRCPGKCFSFLASKNLFMENA